MQQWINETINTLGYAGIALMMFLENVFPPIPSEVIMPLGGFASTESGLTLLGVILAGTLGSVLGQLPLYYLGRAVGEARLKRWAREHGRWVMVSEDEIERAKRWFDEHGGAAVLVCRLIPGIRSLISIPAGFAEMPLLPFLLYSALGMGAWATALAFAGRALGENYEQVGRYLGPISYVVLGGLVLATIVWLWRHHQRAVERDSQSKTTA